MELLSKNASFLSRLPGRFLISECKSTHFFNNCQMFCRENFKAHITHIWKIYAKTTILQMITLKNFFLILQNMDAYA